MYLGSRSFLLYRFMFLRFILNHYLKRTTLLKGHQFTSCFTFYIDNILHFCVNVSELIENIKNGTSHIPTH